MAVLGVRRFCQASHLAVFDKVRPVSVLVHPTATKSAT